MSLHLSSHNRLKRRRRRNLKYRTAPLQAALRCCWLFTLLALLVGPISSSRILSQLERIQEAGQLVVISRNGPTTYYEDAHGSYTGFEYILAKSFAKHLGVELVVREVEDLGRMIDEVGTETGDFAAAGLTITPKRMEQVLFADPYFQVTQQLIYNTGSTRPQSIEDLIGKKIVVIANSSHAEGLREWQKDYPTLVWEERHDMDMLDLLEMVHSNKIDHAIVDSNAFDINTTLYPRAQVAFDISEPEHLAWAFPQSQDQSLYQEAQQFIRKMHRIGKINDIKETFYGYVGKIDYGGALTFTHRLKTRLPKWEKSMKKAAGSYDLDWQLLAALSYQESHWNPKARSHTGVRGFMMLTRTTAKEMNVNNRLNPEQSIDGGARYFKKILNRIPTSIKSPDRTWFALAAYNIGLGHVQDARILTEQHGGNPDKWSDLKEYLPLLAKRKYYKHTKHGYARGWEAVDYVQNIRNFYTVIAWHEVEKERLAQLAQSEGEKPAEFSPAVSDAVKNLSTAL